MSIKVMTHVWEYSKAEGSELLLLLAIADFADDSGVAYPGTPVLSRKCRQSERTTQRLVQRLEKIKELQVKRGDGRGNRTIYRVVITKKDDNLSPFTAEAKSSKGDKLTPFEKKKGDKSGRERVTHVSSHHEPSWNHHETNKQTRAHAREGVSEKSSRFILPSLAEFTEKYLDSNLESWLEENAPAVTPQQATADFIDHHKAENTNFKSSAVMLRAWRGWMLNAQRFTVERSEQKATRKEISNGTVRKAGASGARNESRNLRNIRETVEEFGIAEPASRLTEAELVRKSAADLSAAKRAASQELIRKSIDRQQLARSNERRAKRTPGSGL